MNYKTFLESLVKIEYLDLFGEKSHAKLSPPYRLKLAKKMKEQAITAKIAGVMALFYPDQNNQAKLILILRNTYKGVHSAQVGFPGGKFEDEDDNIHITALRETEEEIGVLQNLITTIAPISQIYIPPSNFLVHPFIGFVSETPNFIKEESEVQKLIEVSVDDLLKQESVINTKVETSFGVSVEVPAFVLNGYTVWGATAMILSEIKDLLNEVL